MAYDDDPYPTANAEKFVWQPGEIVILGMCFMCRWKSGKGNLCKAFPLGIPQEIQAGDFDHREAFPGDNGVRFEAVPGVDIDAVWRIHQGRP